MAKKSINDIKTQRRRLLGRLANSSSSQAHSRALRVIQAGDKYIDNIERSKGYKRNENRVEKIEMRNAISSGAPYRYFLDNADRLLREINDFKAGRNTYMGLSKG